MSDLNRRRLAAYKKTGKKTEKTSPQPPADAQTPSSNEGLSSRIPPIQAAPPNTKANKDEGFYKTTLESKYRKVAKFLVLIGKDEAAGILSRLDPKQVEEISREIAGISRISNDEAEKILAEFRNMLADGFLKTTTAQGGTDAARDILNRAFGKEAGEAILKKTVPSGGLKPFDFLEEYEGQQIALVLGGESPATIALILARVSPTCAAKTIKHLDKERRSDVLKRIASLAAVSPEVLGMVASALREKFTAIGRQDSDGIDGRFALAEILKRSDFSFGEKLLQELHGIDPKLAEDIQKKIYTLDDIVRANDRPLQEYLRSMDNSKIVLLLRGKSEAFQTKIRANLSKNRRILIDEEDENLGPLPRVEVEEQANIFLTWFRKAREEGNIVLEEDAQEYV